jgi:AcrR family transcriptional regulator
VDPALAERLLETALTLAEARGGWDALRLHDVADALSIPLTEVQACYAQKDALAEAWFDRADRAALRVREDDGFAALPPEARLERVLLAWLDALAPHRRLTRGMLAYKLEPGHLHLQLPGLVRVSRTVQWFREAAGEDGTGLRRIVDETGLTLIYLRAFARWLYDESPGARRTREWLGRALQRRAGCLTGKGGAGRDVSEARDMPADADTEQPNTG